MWQMSVKHNSFQVFLSMPVPSELFRTATHIPPLVALGKLTELSRSQERGCYISLECYTPSPRALINTDSSTENAFNCTEALNYRPHKRKKSHLWLLSVTAVLSFPISITLQIVLWNIAKCTAPQCLSPAAFSFTEGKSTEIKL